LATGTGGEVDAAGRSLRGDQRLAASISACRASSKCALASASIRYDDALNGVGVGQASHMMREVGTPLEVIQQRMGHASIRTTADIYGSLPESVDRDVAAQRKPLFQTARGADVVQRTDDYALPG